MTNGAAPATPALPPPPPLSPEERWAKRRRALIPVLIALTSVLGSIGAWRASSASGAAAAAERLALSNSVSRQWFDTASEFRARQAQLSYAQAVALYSAASELRDAAASAQSAGLHDQAALLQAAAAAQEAAAEYYSSVVPAPALGPDQTLDLVGLREADSYSAKRNFDLDPVPEMDEAAAQRVRSQRLVGLTAFLFAAALFLTLAEVTRNRRVGLLYWYGGSGVLVVSMVLLVVVELL